MAAKQSMMQVITKVAKAAIMAAKEAETHVNTAVSVKVMSKTGGPALKQPTFN